MNDYLSDIQAINLIDNIGLKNTVIIEDEGNIRYIIYHLIDDQYIVSTVDNVYITNTLILDENPIT